MNRENWDKTDTQCNVCNTGVVEVGTASSRCSNRHCDTRDRGCPLDTSSSPEEIAEYYGNELEAMKESVALTESEARDKALTEFENYIRADSRAEAEEAEIRTDAFLDLTDKGWGWLKEESDAV